MTLGGELDLAVSCCMGGAGSVLLSIPVPVSANKTGSPIGGTKGVEGGNFRFGLK